MIDRAIAEKERGLLEQDYAEPCTVCGGVVFEWWDSDTCRDCENVTEETTTEQTRLMTDGGVKSDTVTRDDVYKTLLFAGIGAVSACFALGVHHLAGGVV